MNHDHRWLLVMSLDTHAISLDFLVVWKAYFQDLSIKKYFILIKNSQLMDAILCTIYIFKLDQCKMRSRDNFDLVYVPKNFKYFLQVIYLCTGINMFHVDYFWCRMVMLNFTCSNLFLCLWDLGLNNLRNFHFHLNISILLTLLLLLIILITNINFI